ncbi:hypothetical protein GGD67_005972 [Bradyrhizobium sp. IAR9]|uniref:hypothetical protein n=1 Tax=Bradyrhizobium sp. IAR9 TaxID=2663841 RepID=UPI0015C84EAD|nr:hypothetical protein [Bradyrhizobium sp. IAR9]NYG48487.1 hypothetical protein [Bradyrhizobium sp. IAR9]
MRKSYPAGDRSDASPNFTNQMQFSTASYECESHRTNEPIAGVIEGSHTNETKGAFRPLRFYVARVE